MATTQLSFTLESMPEDWQICHALRELIANALDEQVLSGTRSIKLYKDKTGNWHIRDFGRGLQAEHLSQTTSAEKQLRLADTMGRRGQNLKIALLTLQRHKVETFIYSPFGVYRFNHGRTMSENNPTNRLHLIHDDRSQPLKGTDVVLQGITQADLVTARQFFRKYATETLVEQTRYGEILARSQAGGRVYLNHVLVCTEPNYLFSYNIISLSKSMQRKLNQIDFVVEPSIYRPRIQTMLTSAKTQAVQNVLIKQAKLSTPDDQRDELQWPKVQAKANRLLAAQTGLTQIEQTVHEKTSGYQVELFNPSFPTASRSESSAPKAGTLDSFAQQRQDQPRYQFVEPDDLTETERAVYNQHGQILTLLQINQADSPPVRVSEAWSVKINPALGLWDNTHQSLIISRAALDDLPHFASALLHALSQQQTGAKPSPRKIETALLSYLGQLVEALVE
ncbi:ATP-binding protein [Anaerolineales bacterium HSG24]|nr:ATP-binding protein [Anaerolineales bacterium HSG24]